MPSINIRGRGGQAGSGSGPPGSQTPLESAWAKFLGSNGSPGSEANWVMQLQGANPRMGRAWAGIFGMGGSAAPGGGGGQAGGPGPPRSWPSWSRDPTIPFIGARSSVPSGQIGLGETNKILQKILDTDRDMDAAIHTAFGLGRVRASGGGGAGPWTKGPTSRVSDWALSSRLPTTEAGWSESLAAGGGRPGGPGGAGSAAGRFGHGARRVAGLAGALVVGGLPYAQYQVRALQLGLRSGLMGSPLESWMSGAYPGLGQPPASWAGVGVGQKEALSLLGAFPMIPHTARGMMRIPGMLGGANLMPGLAGMGAGAIGSLAGRAAILGWGSPGGSVAAQTRRNLGMLGGIRGSAIAAGLPPDFVTQSIMGLSNSLAAGGGPGSGRALTHFLSPFFFKGGSPAAEAALASQAVLGPQQMLGTVMTSPNRQFLFENLAKYATPGAHGGLAKLLGGSKVYSRIASGTVGGHIFAAYQRSYAANGPASPITVRLLTEALKYSSRLAPGWSYRAANVLGPIYGKSLGAGTSDIFGAYLTGMTLPAYDRYKYGKGGLSTAAPIGAGTVLGNMSWAGGESLLIPGGGPNAWHSGQTGHYMAGLFREGYGARDARTTGRILAASKAVGMNPLVAGALIAQESGWGRADLRGHWGGQTNLMQLTSSAVRDLTGDKAMTSARAESWVRHLTKTQNIMEGLKYLRIVERERQKAGLPDTMTGVFHGYGPHNGSGYGARVMGRLSRGMGLDAPLAQALAGYQHALTYGPKAEAAGLGISGGAYAGGVLALDTITAAGHVVGGFADVVRKATQALQDFRKSLLHHGQGGITWPGAGGIGP